LSFKKINKHVARYNRWYYKKLGYDFNQVFSLIGILYFFSVITDLGLTYLTFRFCPEHFFNYEWSYPIKQVAMGNKFFLFLSIVAILVPLFFPVVFYYWEKKKFGFAMGNTRIFLFLLYFGSFMHFYGAFSNFVFLVLLSYNF